MRSSPECLTEVSCVDLTDIDKVYLLQLQFLSRVQTQLDNVVNQLKAALLDLKLLS